MTGILIFIVIVELFVIGWQYREIQAFKKDRHFYLQDDQLKDDVKK